MIAVPLPTLRKQLDYSHYYRVTKALGGVRKIGADALVPVLAVLETLGPHEAMRVLCLQQQPSATQARFFAATLANIVATVFFRRSLSQAAQQAVTAARDFASGKILKSQLARAHAEALAAEKAACHFGIENSAVLSARAAAACSAPFGTPSTMLWDTYIATARAAAMGDAHFEVASAIGAVLEAVHEAYLTIKEPTWTGEERGAAGIVFVAARQAGFKRLDKLEESRASFDISVALLLRQYLAGNRVSDYV